MDFQIVWSAFAENQLDKIYEYLLENAGLKVANNIFQKIIAEPEKLISHPEIAQVEELLAGRENEYRYLVLKNYKIIYSLDQKKGFIKIADVFDTRQNPVKIKRNKEF